VNNLTYQTSPFGSQIATNAWEISTGSVAFDAPFGPTVIDLASAAGLLTLEQKAFYNSLPVANDADSLSNDKDDFIKNLLNDGALTPLGYDPVGLDENLPVAAGKIEATLLQGDYLATHTYGWTEFDIDPLTQILTVTTYGIEPYSEAELLADPTTIIDSVPVIVSQFEVNPQGFTTINGTEIGENIEGNAETNRIQGFGGNDTIAGEQSNDLIFGGDGDDVLRGDRNSRSAQVDEVGGDDLIYGGAGNDRLGGKSGNDELYGEEGNDQIWGDDGDDLLWGGKGNDTLTGDNKSGGKGSDIFVLAAGEGTDTITDFQKGIDKIGLYGDIGSSDLTLTGNQIKLGNEVLAILNKVDTESLGEADFTPVVL
jgi:Ca2+-binding RTX toxin-like protein